MGETTGGVTMTQLHFGLNSVNQAYAQAGLEQAFKARCEELR